MSEFHTLQELNLDAARYRWLRQHITEFVETYLTDGAEVCHLTPGEVDAYIDEDVAEGWCGDE